MVKQTFHTCNFQMFSSFLILNIMFVFADNVKDGSAQECFTPVESVQETMSIIAAAAKTAEEHEGPPDECHEACLRNVGNSGLGNAICNQQCSDVQQRKAVQCQCDCGSGRLNFCKQHPPLF